MNAAHSSLIINIRLQSALCKSINTPVSETALCALSQASGLQGHTPCTPKLWDTFRPNHSQVHTAQTLGATRPCVPVLPLFYRLSSPDEPTLFYRTSPALELPFQLSQRQMQRRRTPVRTVAAAVGHFALGQ